MKLIEIIKKNIIGAVAVAMVMGLSAFKAGDFYIESKSVAVTKWYPVAPDGETINTGSGQDEAPNDEGCQPLNSGSTCFIRMTTNGAVPTTVSDAHNDPSLNILEYFRDE